MPRNPKNFTIEQVETTDLTTLDYEVPPRTVTSASMVLTNLTSNIIDITVFINDTSTDYMLASNKIAAGAGKTWRVIELSDEKLNEGFKIKVQATTPDAFNVFLSGSEISES